MTHKAVGLWLGGVILTGSACATTSGLGQGAGSQPSASSTTASTSRKHVDLSGAAAEPPDDTGATANGAASLDQPSGGGTSASDPGATDSGPSVGIAPVSGSQAANDNSQSVRQQKNGVMASADTSQPGIVQGYSNGALTIAGQQQGAHSTPRTVSLKDSVPIFEGDTRVGTDALTPGTDVRVYYRNPVSGSQREVIGIDIVTPGQGNSTAPGELQNPGDRTPSSDTGTANPSDENPKQGPGTDE